MKRANNIDRAYKWLQTHYWTKLGVDGYTPLFKAAERGGLLKVPNHILTQENITRMDTGSYYSPLHYAAERGHLDQLPKELITRQTLLIKNGHGETALHFAAGHGNLNQLPQELLTEDIFSVQAENKSTPLHWAAGSNFISHVPKNILTDRNLLIQMNNTLDDTTDEQTVIGLIRTQGYLDDLLGLELGEECQRIAGKEWTLKNNSILAARKTLSTESATADEMDLF